MSTQIDNLTSNIKPSLQMASADARQSIYGRLVRFAGSPQIQSVAFTTSTTFLAFAIYLVQGILLARLLGPESRGHFGTCLYFPRDLLLYAGLLGGIEILAAHSARMDEGRVGLRRTAFRLGLITGACTAIAGAALATILLSVTGQSWLIPYALVCSLFVPIEHIQLNVAAVDRGAGRFARYNISRLLFALSFPVLVAIAWYLNLAEMTGMNWLWTISIVWLVSRVVGVIPTLLPIWRAGREIDSAEAGQAATVRQLLKEGRPYALSTFVTELFERLDILLVLVMCSMFEAGHYFVALPAAAMLTIIPGALAVYAFNHGATPSRKVLPPKAVQGMLLVAGIQLVTALLYALVVGKVVVLLFSDSFAETVSMVLWLLPAFAIKGFLQATESWLKGRGVTAAGVRARMIGIVIMLLFVAACWPALGLPAIPLAAAAGQLVSLVLIVSAVLTESREDLIAVQEGR